MMEREERLLRALGSVGSDLIDTAEQKKFPKSPWRRWLPLAVCAAILAAGALWIGSFVKTAPACEPAPQEGEPTAQAQGERPAEPLPLPEPEEKQEKTVRPRERLTVLDTVYYVEGRYLAPEAEPELGKPLGVVTAADRPELAGSAVYEKAGSTRRDGLPLEIFVQEGEAYLYCLTYYASALPLHRSVNPMQWPRVMDQLRLPPELLELSFSEPVALTGPELLQMFRLTLLLEEAAGQRTEDLNRYLWYDEGLEAYAVPLQDVLRQLNRYLEGFNLEPGDCPAWDKELEAFLLPGESAALPAETPGAPIRRIEPVYLEDGLLLTLALEDRTVEYELELTPDRCLFRSITLALP